MTNSNSDASAPRWDEPAIPFDPPMESVRRLLADLWIFTMPELLSAFGALTRLTLAPPDALTLSGAIAHFEKEASGEAMRNVAKDYWLGETPKKVVLLPYGDSDATRRPQKIQSVSRYRLPEEHVIETDAPIRDQGEEGSCVAHTLAAIIEYHTRSAFSDEDALELYEASRRIDGFNESDGGTTLAPAIQTAQSRGLWPGALVLAPGDVTRWKETLSDADGQAAPIAAGFRVFASACGSKASRLSGKWTLPFVHEIPIGMHAVAIFGYRDDPSAPGGGYFIARNSWGEEYASQSFIGRPGYALIPYRYAQEYCEEAYAPLADESPERVASYEPQDEFEDDVHTKPGRREQQSESNEQSKGSEYFLASGRTTTAQTQDVPGVNEAGSSLTLTIRGGKCVFWYCPAGTFKMGSPDWDWDRRKDEVQHEVRLTKGYWLLETLVTSELWHRVMWGDEDVYEGDEIVFEGRPMTHISRWKCFGFIEKLNDEGLAPKGMKFDLPTEAEWEYACRAGSTTRYSFGNVTDHWDACWAPNNILQPVKKYSPNAWNLWDMHGNAWEWVFDWYGDYSTGSVTDPKGPTSGPGHVLRGGSWDSSSEDCRSASRHYDACAYRSEYRYYGFRLALRSAE